MRHLSERQCRRLAEAVLDDPKDPFAQASVDVLYELLFQLSRAEGSFSWNDVAELAEGLNDPEKTDDYYCPMTRNLLRDNPPPSGTIAGIVATLIAHLHDWME